MKMKSQRRPELRIAAKATRRKHELPAPFGRRVRKFARERLWNHNPAIASREIALMLTPNLLQVVLQALAKRLWQHHPPILLPFSPAHRDLPPTEIDVLDAQFQ